MPVYSVDSDAVLSSVAAARGSSERVRSEVAALLANLTGLQQAWTGGAASAFQTTVEQWRSLQQVVEEQLLSLNTALESAGRSYGDTEQAAQSLFR